MLPFSTHSPPPSLIPTSWLCPLQIFPCTSQWGLTALPGDFLSGSPGEVYTATDCSTHSSQKHISHYHYNTKLWFLIITVLPPRWISGKESTHQSRRRRFNPCVGKIPWRRKQLTPVLLPGKSHGQRGLARYSPRSCRRVRVT